MFDLVNHSHRLSTALLKTEIKGLKVDLFALANIGQELQDKIIALRKEMREAVDFQCSMIEQDMYRQLLAKYKTEKGKRGAKMPLFNFDSPKQLGILLKDYLKLPLKVTKKGNPSTSANALVHLQGKHFIIDKITELSKLTTYYGTFVQGMLDRAEGDRLYPSFLVTGTATGRIAHQNPNMANWPSKGEYSKIRNVLIPEDGEVIVKGDYGMGETVIAAHYSQDKNLLKIIHEGASQHDITAEGLGIERTLAKKLNYAMTYGCSAFKVKSILNCSEKAAQEAVDKYWETYGGLKGIIDQCHKAVNEGGTVTTLFGRQRQFIKRKRAVWDKEYRQAFNFLIQSSLSDLTSMAFYLVAERMEKEGWGRGGWTCHDEIINFAKKDKNDLALKLLSDTMVDVGRQMKLTVPLTVSSEGGLSAWKK